MSLPHFIIIGAQRSGTTSLFSYLMEHPRVAPPTHKEVHFFDLEYARGADWYRAQFPGLGPGMITGEASPYYLFHPHAARRIQAWDPAIKLIALLRDPVERAHSHYHHEVRSGRETLSLESALAAEEERLRGEHDRIAADETYHSPAHRNFSYLARGRYVEQLVGWMPRPFPREQVLILRSEDFYAAPAIVLRRVTDFLGLPPLALGRYARHNDGRTPAMNPRTRAFLQEYFRPFNARLYAFLGRDLGWDDAERFGAPTHRVPA